MAVFGYIPGEIIFQAMKDGEPLAFVLVFAVVAAIVIGLVFTNAKGKGKSAAA
jgi:hypothetical protein